MSRSLGARCAPCRRLELGDGRANVGGHLLDVVVDSVEQSALVDDERAEVFEDFCELGDRLCDVDDLAVATVDG